jgi:Undecaprenyl-phosphate galactose phosphotransferase WbaP
MHAREQRLRPIGAAIDLVRPERHGLAVVRAPSGRTQAARRAQRLRRAFDIAFASLLGLAALPFGLLIALAIRLESRGPVFFAHTRVGRGQKPFRLWKFRSMAPGADETLRKLLEEDPERAREWALTRKLRNDPRVTRVGRFLRRTSLDELPQLWNVVRGDMSMVGPRPIVAEEVSRYGPAIMLYAQVAPGLTGLWQVSGRNDTHYSRRVALDSDYIRNRTLAMDFSILLNTVRVVVCGRGAY